MRKILIFSALSLAAALPVTGVVFASGGGGSGSVPFCNSSENITDNADLYALDLRGLGVNASSVEEWNGCLRAFVTTADGKREMMFFDPDTLRQVGPVIPSAS